MYREHHSNRPGILLLGQSSTFRLRFFVNLRQRRAVLIGIAIVVLGITLTLALTFSWALGLPMFETILWIVGVGEALYIGPALLWLVIVAAIRSPNERLLPSRMILREEGVEVFPYRGDPFEARWNYIAEAIERPGVCELVLRREPRLIWIVAKTTMSPAHFDLLMRWLRENRLLRA